MRAFTIARADLLRRVRNRSAVVTAFVGPLAMALVFSLLLSGAQEGQYTVGVVDADGSSTSRGLIGGLEAGLASGDGGGIRLVRLGSVDAARRAVDEGDADAAVVVPAGFEARVSSGAGAALTVLRSPDQVVGGLVGEAVARSLAGQVRRVDLAVRAAAAASGTPPSAELVAEVRSRQPPAVLSDDVTGVGQLDASAFYGASASILFLFFTVGFASRSMIEEHRTGTLARMLATPTSATQVIAGKTLSVAVLAIAGFCTVWAVTSLFFDADWGPAWAVFVLIVATVAAMAGVASLVASLARSPQQAEAIAAAVTFGFAILGGNFVGPNAPPLLRQLSLLTPNGWALRAFTDLSVGDAVAGDIGRAVGVLLAIGVVAGTIGGLRIHRVVAR